MNQYFIYSLQQPYELKSHLFSIWETETERLNNLSQVTQLVNGQTRFQSQTSQTSKPCALNHLITNLELLKL